MPDFKNAKIYKLWCHETNEIYVGSTTQSLANRLSKHKSPTNTCNSKILFEKSNNVMIELLELFPCENKMYLNKKEGEFIRKFDCVNKNIAGRTQPESKKHYVAENKEIINKKQNQKITCNLCNCEVSRTNFLKHTKSKKHQGALATVACSAVTDSGSTTDSTVASVA